MKKNKTYLYSEYDNLTIYAMKKNKTYLYSEYDNLLHLV